MPDKSTSCCFTGHRASKLPWGFDESDIRCVELKQRIADALEAVYDAGARHFLCGMANGCDMYFAEAVIALRSRREGITLESAIPYVAQADRWGEELHARYKRLLDECDYTTLVAREFTPGCYQRRNNYMVDASSVLIAVYDGQSGGTMSTMLYAMRKGLEIIEISI